MNLFTTIDVVYTRMERDTRIEIPVYKLIHVRKYTCLKPYVLQIIRVWNHTRYKSYALQIIRVWNHTRYKSYAYEIIRVTINHTRMKWRHFIGRSATHPCLMPRSHQTRSQYVLQNVAERGQTVCQRNEGCDNCLESFYELNGRFMDAVDGLERDGHSRTSRRLKILRRPSRTEIGWSDNVPKTRWTFYERNCRTSDLLGTHYNVVQSGISYSTCAHRPRAFLLRWSRSHTDPTRPYCDRNHFYSD